MILSIMATPTVYRLTLQQSASGSRSRREFGGSRTPKVSTEKVNRQLSCPVAGPRMTRPAHEGKECGGKIV